MQRVLIVSSNFHYFNKCIANAFVQLGFDTRVEVYDTPIHPYTFYNKVRYKIGNKAELKANSLQRYQPRLIHLFNDYHPDYVFVVNGENVAQETLQYFRATGTKILLWLFDRLLLYPELKRNILFADYVCCYDKEDIATLKALGKTAFFLPQAVDASYYFPINDVEKEWDIVFAGEIWSSVKRKQLLQAVVRAFPNLRIRIWGRYKPWNKGLWHCLMREHREIYTNRNTSAQQLNLDYNKARLVLNIHHEQQRDGANPKVYEIAASGAYQVCDENPYLKTLFPNNEIGFYNNENEMIDQIRWALAPENATEIARRAALAHQRIMQSHTYTHRMKEMLQMAGLLPNE